MQLFPSFACVPLSIVDPGSIIVCEVANMESAISIRGHPDGEQGAISVYSVFPDGSPLSPKTAHFGQWWCTDNRVVANLGRDYVVSVDPASLMTVIHPGAASIGSALCVCGNDKFVRALRMDASSSPHAYLNLDSGRSVSSLATPFMVARRWSIGYLDPTGEYKILLEPPKENMANN